MCIETEVRLIFLWADTWYKPSSTHSEMLFFKRPLINDCSCITEGIVKNILQMKKWQNNRNDMIMRITSTIVILHEYVLPADSYPRY